MTKLSIFDKIEEAKKIHEPLTKWQNGAFLTKIVWYITTHSVYIEFFYTYLIIWSSTFQKWQNGPFMTKLKKWKKKYTFLSQKMTKLSIFDKIEEAKKIHEPLTKWQNGAFLTKLVWYIITHSVHIVYLCLSHNLKCTFQKWQNGPFLTKLKSEKKYISSLRKWQNWAFLTKSKKRTNPRSSQKMTKLSIFDKIEEEKNIRVSQKMTKLSIFNKIEEAKKSTVLSQKWQNWAFLTKLKNRP